jgi:hypothetical protein
MAAVSWIVSVWWLLSVPSKGYGPWWRPAGSALLRAVAPYGAYGVFFFSIVALPQLVSGGAWDGRYRFDAPFALTTGVALFVLVPVLAQTMVATEALGTLAFPRALGVLRTAQVGEFRARMLAAWRRRLAVAVALDVLACAAVAGLLPLAGQGLAVLRPLGDSRGLLVAVSVASGLVGIGAFGAQVLLALSAPGPAVRAAAAGCAAFVASSGVASVWASPTVAAALGMTGGAAVFAVAATLAADRAFANADLTWYRTM